MNRFPKINFVRRVAQNANPAFRKAAKRGECALVRDPSVVFYGRPEAKELYYSGNGIFSVFRNFASRWNQVAIKDPNKAAIISAGTVFFCADSVAQFIAHEKDGKPWDKKRTFALTSFGLMYYGGFVVRLYRVYDQVLGPKNVFWKAFLDVTVHTPFIVIPAFYGWTHLVEGRTDSLKERLSEDWRGASTASVAYWFPVQLGCFGLIPAVHRVAYVSFGSFVHKAGLSFFAHRLRQIENEEVAPLPLPLEQQESNSHLHPLVRDIDAIPDLVGECEMPISNSANKPTLGEQLLDATTPQVLIYPVLDESDDTA